MSRPGRIAPAPARLVAMQIAALALAALSGCRPQGEAGTAGAPAGGSAAAAAGISADLLLVTLDTVRTERLGAWGGASDVSPHLDGLARQGTLFARCDSASPLTLPSHATLLTGRYPAAHGLRGNGRGRLRSGVPTLADLLQAVGYRTAAFPAAAVLDSRHGLDSGFGLYDDAFADSGERSAGDTVDRALAWWESPGGTAPSLLWVHLYDPHAPYRPPTPWDERFQGRPYEGEIAYADHHLGRLLRAAARRGALVAVIGDHGEGLGDHGEMEHGLLLYQTTLSVPWVLAGPGVAVGRVEDRPVRTIDLLPTLLARLGLAGPPGLPGRDALTAGVQLSPTATESYAETLMPWQDYGWQPLFALRRGHLKLHLGTYASLFDLRVDPGEGLDLLAQGGAGGIAESPEPSADAAGQAANGAADAKAAAEAMQEQLGAAYGVGSWEDDDLEEVAALERLRTLGYLAGGGGAAAEPASGARVDPRRQTGFHDRVRTALAAYRDREYDMAAGLLEKILEEQPGNPFLLDLSGSVELARGQPEAALPRFALALERTPDRGPVEVRLAEALLATGRPQAAAERAALAMSHLPVPTPPRAVLIRCLALQAAGQADAAGREAAAYLDQRRRLLSGIAPQTATGDAGGSEFLAQLEALALASTP